MKFFGIACTQLAGTVCPSFDCRSEGSEGLLPLKRPFHSQRTTENSLSEANTGHPNDHSAVLTMQPCSLWNGCGQEMNYFGCAPGSWIAHKECLALTNCFIGLYPTNFTKQAWQWNIKLKTRANSLLLKLILTIKFLQKLLIYKVLFVKYA